MSVHRPAARLGAGDRGDEQKRQVGASVLAFPHMPARARGPIGDGRRDSILQATEELLRERPLGEISVGDIAAAAKVARSGFYFYFTSKGAVVSALLGDVFAEIVTSGAEFMDGASPKTETVRVGLASTWEAWRHHQGLILAMLDARAGDAEVRALWDAWVDRFASALHDPILRQRQTGLAVPGPAMPELLAVLLAANERTFERLSRSGADDAAADRALEALTSLWAWSIYGAYEPPHV